MINDKYVLKDYGHIEIKLKELLQNRKIKKSKFASYAQVTPDLISRYCSGNVVRVDIDLLARFCDILECDITDLLIYKKPKKEGNEE